MSVTQSGYQQCRVFEDFNHGHYDIVSSTSITTFVPGTGSFAIGQVGYCSVNEGTVGLTVTESNGILAMTSDTGDDDNNWLFAGPVTPSVNGPIILEARYRQNSTTLGAISHGLTQTFAQDTPVMPAEFATATMTYNGTGQMVGVMWDSDATTKDFRAYAGTAGAVTGTDLDTGAPLVNAGKRAQETMTAAEWFISRVEVDASGRSEIYVGHKGRGLDLIARFSGLGTTNTMFATLGYENRTAAARLFEVDYFALDYARDWEVT